MSNASTRLLIAALCAAAAWAAIELQALDGAAEPWLR